MPLRSSCAVPRLRYRPQRAGRLIHDRLVPVRPIARIHSSVVSPVCPSIPTPSCAQSRASLRRELRQRRRHLTSRQQRQAARGMVTQLLRHGALRRAQRVALYLPADGELDPMPLVHWLQRFNISVYVPVLRPSVTPGLWFIKLTPHTRLTRNRFGLLEPVLPHHACRAHRCSAWALDIVLMPLVGFDAQGARLGMGGGFYDRTFSRARYGERAFKRPRLIGLAHDVQEVAALPTEAWDVPLDMIVTGTRCLSPQ